MYSQSEDGVDEQQRKVDGGLIFPQQRDEERSVD
jgi:hypothetical protein